MHNLNPATQDCLIATFALVCVFWSRCGPYGYNRNFTIVDPGEQRTLMKRILQAVELGSKKKWNERSILEPFPMLMTLIDDVAYSAQAGDNTRKSCSVLYSLSERITSVGVG